jgi:hypothetical protein
MPEPLLSAGFAVVDITPP